MIMLEFVSAESPRHVRRSASCIGPASMQAVSPFRGQEWFDRLGDLFLLHVACMSLLMRLLNRVGGSHANMVL